MAAGIAHDHAFDQGAARAVVGMVDVEAVATGDDVLDAVGVLVFARPGMIDLHVADRLGLRDERESDVRSSRRGRGAVHLDIAAQIEHFRVPDSIDDRMVIGQGSIKCDGAAADGGDSAFVVRLPGVVGAAGVRNRLLGRRDGDHIPHPPAARGVDRDRGLAGGRAVAEVRPRGLVGADGVELSGAGDPQSDVGGKDDVAAAHEVLFVDVNERQLMRDRRRDRALQDAPGYFDIGRCAQNARHARFESSWPPLVIVTPAMVALVLSVMLMPESMTALSLAPAQRRRSGGCRVPARLGRRDDRWCDAAVGISTWIELADNGTTGHAAGESSA